MSWTSTLPDDWALAGTAAPPSAMRASVVAAMRRNRRMVLLVGIWLRAEVGPEGPGRVPRDCVRSGGGQTGGVGSFVAVGLGPPFDPTSVLPRPVPPRPHGV